ncbi:MAG: SPFH domain-containing protein [Desulfobacterales bacterium]|nr:SPFH domain-containing protein [Desulfobacterales bacterium]
MKVFISLKWGTRDPVAFKDSELGLIRLRSFGVFNVQVVQPVLFVNTLVGTQGVYTTAEIESYLNQVIVSRFNDYLGGNLDTVLNLPGRYESIADGAHEDLSRRISPVSVFACPSSISMQLRRQQMSRRQSTTRAAWDSLMT